MKISTTWSKEDWIKALKKTWELSDNFEEILNFGLEHGFITNSDIIHASDIYKDPYKEYDDDEIKDMISSRGLRDVMSIIQNNYSLDEIIDELPTDEILDNINESERFESLERSWTLENHDNEIRLEAYNEGYNDGIKEDFNIERDYIKELANKSIDEKWKFLANLFGVSNYESKEFREQLSKFIHGLNKSVYKDKSNTFLLLCGK